MALNGSEFVNDPIGTMFSPFTDFFQNVVNNGQVFYMIPLIVLTIGIYIITDGSMIMATMFMVGSGGILALGSFLAGAGELGMIMTIFTAIGFAGMFISLLLQKRG